MAETESKPSPSTSDLSRSQLAALLRAGQLDSSQVAVSDENAMLHLIATEGPSAESFDVAPPGPHILGRGADCDIRLSGSEHVSRQHAIVVYDATTAGGGWLLKDNKSRHGTWLNGLKLEADRNYPLASQDVIEIHPWTLRVKIGSASEIDHMTTVQTAVQTQDGADIRPLMVMPGYEQQLHRLELLLECSERFQKATGMDELTKAVLDMLAAGTGFGNTAVLGPLDDKGGVPVIAHRGEITLPDGAPRLSHSLIKSASAGNPVSLSSKDDLAVSSESIAELGIAEAVCVPLLVGRAVVGYLYLDHRQSDQNQDQGITEEEAQFAVAIGRLAALAWANLRRQEIQLRSERMDAALSAAAVAQRWVLPTDEVSQGPFRCLGDNRAGELLSGDFFDIMTVGTDDVAVVLGDVCGKGVAASIWTTAAQGFLRASLRTSRDLPRVVSELNQYMQGRSEVSLFMSLWIGLFESKQKRLSYIDAGHGYAFLLSGKAPQVQLNMLSEAGGPLIGLEESAEYVQATVDFNSGQRVLIVSDGIIEQPNPSSRERNDQFGVDGVLKAAAKITKPGEELKAIYKAVDRHAKGLPLSDDATVVMVQTQ